MSFILDALKKSESDRQRQTGPALYEVRVPPPRHGLPLWALAVVALLAVNLVIGLWMLLHRGAAARGADATAAAAPALATPAAVAPPAAPPAAQAALAPASAPVNPAPGIPTQPVSAQLPPGDSGGTATARISPPAAPAAESSNPEDYVPAGPAAPGPATAAGTQGHVQRGTAEGVPLYQDVATAQGASLPQLRLDLHVFAPQPAQRFVMINMRKLREGDTTPEGVHVDAITPDGAVLSYNGSKFLLTRD